MAYYKVAKKCFFLRWKGQETEKTSVSSANEEKH